MNANEWIPCSETMPPWFRIVLTYAPVGDDNWTIRTGSCGELGWYTNNNYEPKPTHWMPLPDPPQDPRSGLRGSPT